MSQSKLAFEGSPTKIRGEVQRIRFKNADNGFHILLVLLPDGGNAGPNYADKMGIIAVKVTHPNIAEGMTLEFHGSYYKDPNYGYQFLADRAHEVPPSTTEGLIAYLSCSFFKGIGHVKARRIVKHFGEKTLEVFNTNIDRLKEVVGITETNLNDIKAGWEKNKEINEIMQFLMDNDLSAIYAGKVYETYGQGCVDQIKKDPYDLSRNIRGIGFKKADSIALKLGFAEDSPLRIRACIEHVLDRGEQDGHCFLYHHQIVERSEEYLGFNMDQHIASNLDELENTEDIMVLRSSVDKDRYYNGRLYRNELYCYEKMLELSKEAYNIDIDEDLLFEAIRKKVKTELSAQQRAAIIGILKSRVSILTGGPGTGKTTSTKSVVEALKFYGIDFLLCAPTGRAAKRMKEVIGHNAMTIHRLLVWDPINHAFAHNERNPLPTNCVLIDEFSMVDIHLAAALLRAIPPDAMVIFVGDPDQLPPVGAGNFFSDLIGSKIINTFTLTEIFRQGKGSNIVDFSHAINRGEVPEIETPFIEPEAWKDAQRDCLFIDSGFKNTAIANREHPKWSSLHYGHDVLSMIEELYKNIIPKYHLHPDDIQVLIPMKKGPIGTIAVNKHLQNALNPKRDGLKEIIIGERILRENDKVIQLVNNYDLDVFNGDIGRIVAIDHENGSTHIRYDVDKIVVYTRTQLLDVDLSYAITTHKSQGSEFDFVIMPLMNQYYRMLYRQLIYTGLTRAKKRAIFVGQRDALKQAVNTLNSDQRQTSLKELLIGTLKPITTSKASCK